MGGVRDDAVAYARVAARYYAGDGGAFVGSVDAASVYHDLGKADDENQAVLQRSTREPLRIPHDDAGVAELLRLKQVEAAILAAAHHAGLFSREEQWAKRERAFRKASVADHVDARLAEYVSEHAAEGCPVVGHNAHPAPLHGCGFTRRVALSCLVDADHGDTARHYQNEVVVQAPDPEWARRLASLDDYVAALPRRSSRDELRKRVYRECREAAIAPAVRACDSPVGSGKTTAVMAHLLRVAQARQLRHIFVVLPYTSIIKQSVEVYRKALPLKGEDPEEIVAAHHHLADFGDRDLRQLAVLWRAPIIVTTAVQFFETLGASNPARLRKLHELPGSAVFLDETHAAIPSHLWPQAWKWLDAWTRDWGGHLVLASGSLPRFWELGEFVQPPRAAGDVPDLVSDSLRAELEDAEKRRVVPKPRTEPFSCDGLIAFVKAEPGPQVVILNTVQSAAVVADRMRRTGHDVLHLSTALAPEHRDRIVDRVKERLRYKVRDWTLVATSCVEAGMDFSFHTGFRESASASSLIQIGGRVGRGAEYEDARVWDFRVSDPLLSEHPGFEIPRRVLRRLFDDGDVDRMPPSELAKAAMQREQTEGGRLRAEAICTAEAKMEYPEVSQKFRVIEADTRLVVVSAELGEMVRKREQVGRRVLLRNSVQMWTLKIRSGALPLRPLLAGRGGADDAPELYEWIGEYDPDLLGYMAGVLPLLEGLRDGVFLV